jgi:S1-C subfamily serine protease
MTPSGVGDDGAPYGGDDASWRRPPPPDDRLWRHPSELALPEVRRLGRPALSVLAGLLVGAALATAGVVLLGGSGEPVVDTATGGGHGSASHSAAGGIAVVPTASTLGTVTVGPLVAATVERLSGATVRLAVERGGTTEWGAAFSDGSEDVVVTAAPLVRGASGFSAVMRNGTRVLATLLGADPMTGVAVLRCDGQPLPAPPASAATPHTGDVVLTVTAGGMAVGLVTAVGVDTPGTDGYPVLDAIATDLPGGSATLGAPVLDSHGQLVGMIVSSGVGRPTLAAPVASVRAAAEQLATSGTVAHGWLGVTEATSTPVGLAVGAVDPSSPAAGAGIAPGDLIVAVDNRSVRTMEDLQAAVALRAPGRTVSVSLRRGTRRWTVSVALARLPSS